MPDWLAILKAYVDTLETIVGTEGGLALADKLTAARALLLDRIALLAAGGAGELTAARAAALQRLIDDLTAARAGYLDNINNAQLLQITAARIGYIDLLADAINGLAAIKAEVEGLAGAAMRGTDNAALAASWTAALATALGNYTAARAGYLDNINNAQLLQISAARLGYIDLLATLTAARIGYLDNINQVGLLQVTAARAALLDQITAARLAELDAANIPTDTDPRVMGRLQIKEVAITSAANAGDVLVATVTTQPCLIESVVIHAKTAQTANMTSCGVFGGAGKVITFISATDAVLANLNAIDKQVAWSGAVRLAATKTIVISLVGTGAAAVDLMIVIAYRASVSGGYLV